jgi:hypothetical protein
MHHYERAGRSPRRKYRQFSLLKLLAAVALVAGAAAQWRMYGEPYFRQQQALAAIDRAGGLYMQTERGLWLILSDCDDPSHYLAHLRVFRAVDTLAVSGPAFGDQELRRLHDVPIARLFLDSTSVTEPGLIALREALPGVRVTLSSDRERHALPPFVESGCHGYSKPLDGLSFVTAEWYIYSFTASLTDAQLTSLLGTLPRVLGLRLESMPLTDAALGPLAKQASQLELLELARTQVTDAGLAHLGGLSKLEYLDLSGTAVSDAGLPSLAALGQLTELRLRGTKVTPRGTALLRRELPKCIIVGPGD